MNQETKHRDLARDTRDGKVGEVMAEPGQASRHHYYLRPVGGGLEWDVRAEHVEIIKRAETAA
jgi:hypothetical protein